MRKGFLLTTDSKRKVAGGHNSAMRVTVIFLAFFEIRIHEKRHDILCTPYMNTASKKAALK